MATNQALEAALALALNPSLAISMRQAGLPCDVSALLRFLAGELAASDLAHRDQERLPDVIERYVFAVMLYPGADPMRVLGVTDSASRSQMRAHMRWLMVWLHPDRAGGSWRSSYSARVLEAWRQVSRVPPDVGPLNTLAKPKGRPLTKTVKLAWVAHPVPRREWGRWAVFGPALVVVIAVAAVTAFR